MRRDSIKEKSVHWAWIILATCFVDLFINYSVRLGYGVVMPEMIRTLGLGRAAGGGIYNAYLLSYVVLTPLTGYLTDRLGARWVITACSLILGIGVTLMGTADTLWTACLFYAVVGLGGTGMWTPVVTVVQRWFAPNRRGLALGIMSTGYGLGFATMGAAFPWIVQRFDWRYAWYFLGAAAGAMVLINGLLLRSDPESAGTRAWGGGNDPGQAREPVAKGLYQKGALVQILKSKRFWFVGISYFSIAYSLYGITTFMVDYAKDQLGFPLEAASLLATVHGFCQALGVLTILPLSDYLTRRKTIIISNAVIASCLIGILFTSNSRLLIYVLVAVVALFYGATWPMYGACAGDYFPKGVMGTVIGAWTPFYGLGAILVHWVGGGLRDLTGSYTSTFAINVAMAAVSLVFMCLVPKKRFGSAETDS